MNVLSDVEVAGNQSRDGSKSSGTRGEQDINHNGSSTGINKKCYAAVNALRFREIVTSVSDSYVPTPIVERHVFAELSGDHTWYVLGLA